ncbi:MAG: hypothetical protein WBA97_19235 [Actinophytocola sp.]
MLIGGTAVIDNGGVHGPTPKEGSGTIPLQDHGDSGENPRFRNVWIERR